MPVDKLVHSLSPITKPRKQMTADGSFTTSITSYCIADLCIPTVIRRQKERRKATKKKQRKRNKAKAKATENGDEAAAEAATTNGEYERITSNGGTT